MANKGLCACTNDVICSCCEGDNLVNKSVPKNLDTDWIRIGTYAKQLDRGPWTTHGPVLYGPSHGHGPWTTPMNQVHGPPLIFKRKSPPVNMKIYRRSGHEKHRLVFIAYILEGLSCNSGLLWDCAPINGKTTNLF